MSENMAENARFLRGLDLRRVLERGACKHGNALYRESHVGVISPRKGRLRAGLMLFIPIFVIVLLAGALFGLAWEASGRAIHPGQETYDWASADYPELTAEEVSVESSTGATLAGRFFKGETTATIVLLHGYGGNQDELLPLADHLR